MSLTVTDSKQTDCCENNLTLSLALESNKQIFIPKPAKSALPVCASQEKCFFLKILSYSFFATSPQLQEVPPKRQQTGGL